MDQPVHEVDNAPLIEWLQGIGYRLSIDPFFCSGGDFIADGARLWSDGRYCLAKRLMFHWTIIEGNISDEIGYDDRWCLETFDLAIAGVKAYPDDWPVGFEPPGWHRHPATARRREAADPEQEYIAG